MNYKEIATIKEISKKVRLKFVNDWSNQDLGGLCFEVSEYLQKELYNYGIYTDIIEGEFINNANNYFHYWLEYKGNIIDLTATQFSKSINPYSNKEYPEIMITPVNKAKEYKANRIV